MVWLLDFFLWNGFLPLDYFGYNSPYLKLPAKFSPAYHPQLKSRLCILCFLVCVAFNTVFAHLFANRDQLDNQDESSLSPKNAARALGFSEEAEPCDMRRENQRRETEQSSRPECGYAMLTPRTMMVISIEVLIQCIRV